ncbi:MAG: 23S rRNA (uracil(1939)-C(5))-methyltransferase RlmD [Planctomycetota bacterium]
MKRGTEVELSINRIAERGFATGDLAGRQIHVAHAVPGDTIRAQLLGRRKKRREARLIEVLSRSPLRVEPKCRYFGSCGGCSWQSMIYSAQLDAKRQAVEDAFSGAGLLGEVEVRAVLGSEEIYYYRNKMEFSFGSRRWLTDWEIESGKEYDRDFALGMHVPGFFDRLLDLEECFLQSELTSRLLRGVRAFAKKEAWTAWDLKARRGFLRHMVVRTPRHSDEVMLNLVTNGDDPARMSGFGSFLKSEFPEVTTFVNTVNTGVAQVSTGELVRIIFGTGTCHDRIGPYTFEIAPHSFFQTNTAQAERLYEVAARMAEAGPEDLVYDLYSGLGAISLFLSGSAGRVVGLELDRTAVEAAERIAAFNGVSNVRFAAGDLSSCLNADFATKYGEPRIVILDPPRAGLHPKTVHALRELAPERIVYVSCNPESQARDLSSLAHGYSLEQIQPVDLFPHTHHVENVALLVR